MRKIEIEGGHKINGEIEISGAKNAALPLVITTLLTEETVTLTNVPNLSDITLLIKLMEQFGTEVEHDAANNTLKLTTKCIKNPVAPYEIVSKMRASFFAIGALIARNGEAQVSLPGGCAIGARPLDIHLDALEALGAELNLEEGYVHAKAPNGLKGNEINFKKPSVGATENIMMAAALAKGTTILNNVAREPEITDLGECLIKMGADIEGLGTETITIHGKEKLNGTEHAVMPDRIEAGTFAIAGAIIGDGEIVLKNANLDHIASLIEPLHLAGADLYTNDNGDVAVKRIKDKLNCIDVETEYYPGFPTDLQAQIMTLNTISEGAGMITEKIWENRFMHVPELVRMGANITVHGSSAIVRGVEKLKGAEVMATDLRASASLILAGLVAEGKTTVREIHHLERGYDDMVGKLSKVGAKIRLIDDGK